MSRNAKNRRQLAAAKAASHVRTNGGSGPAKTTPKHGKKNAWFQRGNSNKPKVEEATA